MLFKNTTLGAFYPGNSLIHRLQARTKLLALFWLVAVLTVANQRQWHFAPYIVIVALLSITIALARISPREIWRRIWLLLLLLLLGAIPSLSYRDSNTRVLYAIGPLHTSYATVRLLLIDGSALLILLLFLSLLPLWLEWGRKLHRSEEVTRRRHTTQHDQRQSDELKSTGGTRDDAEGTYGAKATKGQAPIGAKRSSTDGAPPQDDSPLFRDGQMNLGGRLAAWREGARKGREEASPSSTPRHVDAHEMALSYGGGDDRVGASSAPTASSRLLRSLFATGHAVPSIWRKPWLRRCRVLIVLLLLTALIALVLLSGPAATAPLPIGPYLITDNGVWILMTFLVFLIVLYVSSLLLTMTTSPVALVEGLSMLLSPLRRLKLPVDDFGLMCLIALRFMPTLQEEVEQLIKAQTSRGADMTRGTIRERLQSLTTLFIPLMQGVLRRAADLATALEARGYEVEGKQTFLHETSLGVVDYVVLGSLVFVTVSALLF